MTRHLKKRQDPLDCYIEAQIHGPIFIADDTENLSLDPAYRGTTVETQAHMLGIPFHWHKGFQLELSKLARHPEYRGWSITELGRAIAIDQKINPRLLGEAIDLGYSEGEIKKLWHCLARFGCAKH